MNALIRRFGVLNLLLIAMPIAVAFKLAEFSPVMIFVASAVAIIPLAGLMGKSTEMLSERFGPGIGGLLNATFGNAAEMIIAVFALQRGLLGVVKASITGSILGNVLLVLGASVLAGGVKHQKQHFNATAARMSATLLTLAAIGLLVPAFFHAHLEIHHETADELGVSFEIACILFVVYILTLVFSLKTHRHLYSSESAKTEHFSDSDGHVWSIRAAVGVLVAATLGVAWMSEILVSVVELTSEQLGWTEMFVGVVVVAIVGNAAEHSTAILVARKNQMDLSFQIAVGSGLQIALFVAPVLLFISYLPGFEPMDLRFSMMEVVSIVISVMVVGLVAMDGESNWLEGLLLLAVYAILAIAFYHLPAESEKAESGTTLESYHWNQGVPTKRLS